MILIDGVARDGIPADDRGLAYGDGVFETVRARHGALPLLDWHLERLYEGLNALHIPAPEAAVLTRELAQAAAHVGDGVVKLIVSRGSGGRGYAPHDALLPRRIVQNFPLPTQHETWRRDGIAVHVCVTPLEGPRALAGCKHLNRLPQVLARAEWNGADFAEGLMRDTAGRIVEGIASNVFVRLNGALITPPVGQGVRGVMRRLVMALARRFGIELAERHVADTEIAAATEVFITNSILGVCPVWRVGNRRYAIGTMTRLLQSEVENELDRRLCPDT